MAMLPLTISPGPANTMYAASGAAFGWRKTIPLWLGINCVCIIQTLAIGIGLGEVLFRYPAISDLFKYAGIAFMLYLAYRFVRSTGIKEGEAEPLNFKDGAILEFLNFKFLMIPTVMYTQFLDPESSKWLQVLILGLGLNLLNMSGHWVWIIAGNSLTKVFQSNRTMKIQGYIFGSMLLVVAIWIGLS